MPLQSNMQEIPAARREVNEDMAGVFFPSTMHSAAIPFVCYSQFVIQQGLCHLFHVG